MCQRDFRAMEGPLSAALSPVLVVHLSTAGEEAATRLPSTAPAHNSRPRARGARGERSEASRMASGRAGLYASGWNGAGKLGLAARRGSCPQRAACLPRAHPRLRPGHGAPTHIYVSQSVCVQWLPRNASDLRQGAPRNDGAVFVTGASRKHPSRAAPGPSQDPRSTRRAQHHRAALLFRRRRRRPPPYM
jgi:hypothetical protein